MGVTKNGKDLPEHCCRSELMHSENAPNYIFSMFEAFCEDIRLDKRNFDERYRKSFYEAIEKRSLSFHRVTLIQEKYAKHATFSEMSYF